MGPLLFTMYITPPDDIIKKHDLNVNLYMENHVNAVCRAPHRKHITPVLRDLQWLPIHRRIQFQTILLVYLCWHDMAPQYLVDLLNSHCATRSLRSAEQQLLVVLMSKHVMETTPLMSVRPFFGILYQCHIKYLVQQRLSCSVKNIV